MKKPLLISIVFLTLPLSVSLLSAAPSDRPGPGMMLQHLDSDGDGQITKEEFDTGRGERFNSIDTDSNGSLSIGEMDQMREAKREKMRQSRFERMDQDNSGAVTEEEFNIHGLDMFSGMDADQNGVVSQSEIEDWRPMKKGHRRP